MKFELVVHKHKSICPTILSKEMLSKQLYEMLFYQISFRCKNYKYTQSLSTLIYLKELDEKMKFLQNISGFENNRKLYHHWRSEYFMKPFATDVTTVLSPIGSSTKYILTKNTVYPIKGSPQKISQLWAFSRQTRFTM